MQQLINPGLLLAQRIPGQARQLSSSCLRSPEVFSWRTICRPCSRYIASRHHYVLSSCPIYVGIEVPPPSTQLFYAARAFY